MKLATAASILIIGSICFHSASAHMANPQKFHLYDESGEDLGLFHLKGGDINSWIEDEDGYTVCYKDGGSETRHRHLSRERADVRAGVVGNNDTPTHYYYCRLHDDGTIGPNLHLPVATTDPNNVPDHLLPPHVHMTLEQAAEMCGDYCQQSLYYGGSIPSNSESGRKLRGDRRLANYAPSKGRVPNLVIPFKFKGHENRQLPSRADLDVLLNSMENNANIAPTGGVKKYYHEISGGLLQLDSKVIDWIQLDGIYDERYCSGVDFGESKGLGDKFQDCLMQVLKHTDEVVNFRDFETNNDGDIDAITFIHSGYDASQSDGMVDRIWSHQGSLENTFTSNEGIKVKLYSINPALFGKEGTQITTIATMAHELAHFMGLEDLYDRGDGGVGVGAWSVMSADTGFTDDQRWPPAMDPFSKEKLGWGTFKELSASRNTIVLQPSYTSHKYYKITKGFPDGEYLLLENRQRIGFDSKIPGTGLLVWHIDTSKAKTPPGAEEPPFNDEEGHPGQAGWPQNNKHYMVALLAADGDYKFEKGSDGAGDATDLYGKCMGKEFIGPTTSHPNTDTYQGGTIKKTDITIKNIYQTKQNNMVFDICFGDCAPGAPGVPTTLECCKDDSSWKDSDGDGCDKYLDTWCAEAKDYTNSAGVSALTACCVCNGVQLGALPDTPNVEIFPGDGSPAAATPTATATSSCVDNPVWKDSDGEACATHQKDWCGTGANEYATNGVTANSACCICKDSCVDDSTWRDSDGDSCENEGYKSGDACGASALQYKNAAGVHANMACCSCKNITSKIGRLRIMSRTKKTPRRLRRKIAIAALGIQSVSAGFIDMDTPLEKRTTKSLIDGTVYHLVMSDEFNTPNRSFTDGHDPIWTALDKPDDDSSSAGGGSQQFYNSSQVTTEDGMLKIKTDIGTTTWQRFDPVEKAWKKEHAYFQSGMVQSWEKFCFTGGIVEVDVILPGDPYIGGLWPAIWMLGNLGRATYESSTNNLWPWSYDTCDPDRQPAQTISACNSANHYGMHPFQGRGATEIDLVEVMTGISDGPLPSTTPPITFPYCDMTLQVAPGVEENRPPNGAAPLYESKLSPNGHTKWEANTWYEGIEFGGNTSINPFFYGTYLGETKPGEPVTRTKKQAFQADAVGGAHQLAPDHFKRMHTFRLEWQPGPGGRIDWFSKGHKINSTLTMVGDGKGKDWLHAMTILDNVLNDTMGSQIPIEPSYLIMNTAVSSTWGFPYDVPDSCAKCYDCDDPKCSCAFYAGFCKMLRNENVALKIDSVRVYQSRDPSAHVGADHTLGCDPPDYPTKGWIKGHSYRYMRNEPFAFADKGKPLKKIQTGGGECESDNDCGGNFTGVNLTAVYSDDGSNQTIGPTGKCVTSREFHGFFSGSSSAQVCKCEPGFTGPHCLAQKHIDDTDSAFEDQNQKSLFHHIPDFRVTNVMVFFFVGLLVLLVVTNCATVQNRKNSSKKEDSNAVLWT